jgi:hypothetical protein
VNCKLCRREVHKYGFCLYHSKAYKNIREKFRVWEKASNVSWTEYLVEVQKNSLTGAWAKEVANYLIEEENQK